MVVICLCIGGYVVGWWDEIVVWWCGLNVDVCWYCWIEIVFDVFDCECEGVCVVVFDGDKCCDCCVYEYYVGVGL